jgi:DNA-binding transcriptional LysR family regulator
MVGVDTRRLLFLRELARLGSMHEVADELSVTTSTVSQQIAALARDLDTRLIEPDGRRVRLTPAGRRMSEHAITILAAVDAARLDMNPDADPAGTVRVAGFATAIRRSLMPVTATLSVRHPKIRMQIREHEPTEALDLLAGGGVDLALVYDYNVGPARFEDSFSVAPLWSANWGLAVPADIPEIDPGVDARAVFGYVRDHQWIVNSRSTADEAVVRIVGSMAGFEPEIMHRADSLDLVEDLILAGLGVGLLPAQRPTAPGIRLLELHDPEVTLRSYAVTRRGHTAWPPLARILDLLG